MDFWNRAQGKDKGKAKEVPMEEVDYTNSASSSPLTELSSLPDIDEPEASPAPLGLFDLEEVQAALFLCSLHSHHSTASDSKADENEVLRQLEPRVATNGVSKRPPRASSTRAAERIASSRAYAYEPTSSIQRESKPKTKRSTATHRHDDSAAHPPSSFPVPALRELRPRMDHKDAFPASLSAPPHNGIDTSESASVGPQSSISPIDEPSGSKTSARPQRSRNFPRRTPAPLTGVRTSSRTNGTLSELDDDDDDYLSLMEEPFVPSSSRAKISDPADKPRKRGRPPLHKKPITPAPAVVASNPITPSVPKAEASTATPSLKIRLPRLNTINQQASHSNTIHDDAPVPASLAPPTPPQPPKRGRGRPRKYPLDNHNRGPGRPPKSGPRRVERRASSSRTSATEIPLPDTQMALS
ncbi:hypothetical protein QCA50_002697 [Cerrena zonata]|uniref:Uncharacterized protein n=1 Tax=Cerrena zonata TaxID=2478898 RepID=A0AAW0GKE8_9APHY